MRAILLAVGLLFATHGWAALDIRDIALGAKEQDIRRALPSAHCRPLQWQSRAADRRCDDSRVAFGGIEVQVSFYLKNDALEAFDVRFDTRDLERFVTFLKSRYGPPVTETKDTFQRRDRTERYVYKVLWEGGKQRAVLTAQLEKRRASMLVSRGKFEEEIYLVR